MVTYRRNPEVTKEIVPDGVVVYNRRKESLVFLNHTAAMIIDLCDGKLHEAEIARLVSKAYGLTKHPVEDVRSCLDSLAANGLVERIDFDSRRDLTIDGSPGKLIHRPVSEIERLRA